MNLLEIIGQDCAKLQERMLLIVNAKSQNVGCINLWSQLH